MVSHELTTFDLLLQLNNSFSEFFVLASRYSGSELISIIDSIQPGMFGMVIERLILEDTQKVSGAVERKMTAIGLIKLVCETPEVTSGPYSKYWSVPMSTSQPFACRLWSTDSPNDIFILLGIVHFTTVQA